MRIASNTVSDNIVRQIQDLSGQQAKLQTQVATQKRLLQLEDDPAAVGRVLNLDSERRAIDQFNLNADRALEISQATYSSLRQIKSISDRATELGTLGAGALSPEALNAYAAEVDQLLEQTLQLANNRLRNDYLFAGTAVDAPPFNATRNAAGEITSVAFAGNTAQTSIALSETSSVSPGSDATTNQGVGDFLGHLIALRDALRAGGGAAVAAVESNLVATEDVFVSSLAQQGAVQLRIDVNQTQQQERSENLQGLISSETDLDLPAAIVELTQAQTSYQAALQSAGSILQLSLLDYIN
jgi:flagellar hook-associated protein 3 FlgL